MELELEQQLIELAVKGDPDALKNFAIRNAGVLASSEIGAVARLARAASDVRMFGSDPKTEGAMEAGLVNTLNASREAMKAERTKAKSA